MKKRFLSLLLALVLTLGLLPAPAGAVSAAGGDHWAQAAMERWEDVGVVEGRGDGDLHPDDSMTRAELATVLCRLFGYTEKSSRTFTDVPADAWYADAIAKCVAAGVMQGDNGKMRPDDVITRQEAITIIARAFALENAASGTGSFSDGGEIASWALAQANAMAKSGYVQGYNGKFMPTKNITRAEVLTILNNMVNTYINAKGKYTVTGGDFVLVTVPGVTITKKDFTGTILTGGQGEFKLTGTTVTPSRDDDDDTSSGALDGAVATAPTGKYVGKVLDNGTIAWRGIQYATAERFQAPEMVAESSQTIYCYEHGPASNAGDPGALNLVVYANPESTSTNKSVFVWQYGSAQAGGSTEKTDWSNFVKENPDIIVVTPNHRGGFWGSIDLSCLEGYDEVEETYKYSNNLARLDLLECLKWVNKNIASFGGNPDDVTIGGHSSGSNNMTCLLLMEEAHPYFQKAACQASFSVDISLQPLEDAQFVSRDLFTRLGVTTVDQLLAKSADEINAAMKAIQSSSMSGSSAYSNIECKLFSAVVDGVVIPNDYYERLLNSESLKGKTLMFGSNAGEYDQQYVEKDGTPYTDEKALEFTINQNWGKLSDRGWNKDNAQAVIDAFYSHNEEYGRDNWTAAKDLKNDLYLRCGAIMFANAVSRYTDTYFYHLDWDITPENNLRASHGSENNVINRTWKDVPENMLGDADILSDTWAAFIRTGNPNHDGLPVTWTKYNNDTHNTMYFAPELKDSQVVEGVRQKDVDLLLPLFREYKQLKAALDGTSATAPTGTYLGKKLDNGIVKYSNITYAEYERWQKATMVADSDVVIDATAAETQITNQSGKGQEGLLTLDIYVNPKSTKADKGVFVWNTCGGGTGSNSNNFNPTQMLLENPDIIVVVVNIRVGYFGSINLKAFSDYDSYTDENGNNPYQYSNNLMRLDYLESLKWVNHNISAFGGDPDMVTIAGQSAGAANASAMLLIEEAHDYFDQVILESGVAIDRISVAPLSESAFTAGVFQDYVKGTMEGRTPIKGEKVTTIAEALTLDASAFAVAQSGLTSNSIGAYPKGCQGKSFTNVADGVVIPEATADYWAVIEKAAQKGIKVLVGSTNGEYDRDLAGKDADAALKDIVSANWGKLAAIDTETGEPTVSGTVPSNEAKALFDAYAARNDRDTVTAYKDLKNDINQRVSAVMLAEAFAKNGSTAYLWSYEWYAANDAGNRAVHGSEKQALYPSNTFSGPETMAKAMRNAWASFVAYGDPNANNEYFKTANVEWKAYDTVNDWIMIFDETMSCAAGERMNDIESLMPLFAEYKYLRPVVSSDDDDDYTAPTYTVTAPSVDNGTVTVTPQERFQRHHRDDHRQG